MLVSGYSNSVMYTYTHTCVCVCVCVCVFNSLYWKSIKIIYILHNKTAYLNTVTTAYLKPSDRMSYRITGPYCY